MKKSIAYAITTMLVFVASIIPMPVRAVNITAQAAIVIDFDTGEILFERDIHTPRVPASMTKAMTAFVVYEEMERGNLTLDTLIPISENAARLSRDNVVLQGAPFPLDAGTYHTVDTLLHLAMLPSSNGACVALAEFISGTEEAFVQRMNESAAAIGMWSEFTNSHGAVAHYTNAYSIGRLVYEFIHRYPDILRITGAAYYVFQDEARNNTNLLIQGRTIPYYGADGFRTGTTREAGACLASTAYRYGWRIIVVVMNAQNNDRRYSDSIALLDFGFAEAARRDAVRAEALQELQASAVNIVYRGQPVNFSITPRIVDERSMAPARELLTALGVLGYTIGYGYITIPICGNAIGMCDPEFVIVVSSQVIDGEIFISVRDTANAIDVLVEWDCDTRTVSLRR
ncbi:MAG: hypothetical protein FWC89_12530 [Defluviitaleaceae bacterium]|nr:hypothetical protein [Defluviitaleaceae bacterium]